MTLHPECLITEALAKFSSFWLFTLEVKYQTNCIFLCFRLPLGVVHFMSSCFAFINKMPPRDARGSAMKSKKKKSEGALAKLIDISKPGSDHNLKLRDSVPVVKLDKIVISSTNT